MIILFILLIITFFYAIYYKSHKSLHMLQQNLYNENNRYLKWVIKNLQDFISFDIGTIAISLVGVFVIYDLKFVSYLCFAMLALFLILIGYRENKNQKVAERESSFSLCISRYGSTCSVFVFRNACKLCFQS